MICNEHIVAKWHHIATQICVDIGPGNGLLRDDIKPLPEPMLTYDNQLLKSAL